MTTSAGPTTTLTPAELGEVTRWVAEHAIPLASLELGADLADLSPLRDVVRDALVVGIGGSTYGAHEQFALTCRVIRYLVEELGFRSVATEDDWDKGLELNRYVQTGEGQLAELLADAGVPWRTREVAELLEWLRAFNAAHPDDPVQYLGVGVIDTRAPVYQTVEDYVGRVAPDRLAELREHFAAIRPTRPDHVRWFFTEVQDKPALLAHARQAYRVVERVPHAPGDREHALMLQHAGQIVGFYEHMVEHLVDDGYRDRRMAESLQWWHQHTGHRIAYWSTNAHSIRSAELFISTPPRGTLTFTPTGHWLREAYGDRYVSLGLTFDSGTVHSGWAFPPFRPLPMPAGDLPADFAEHPLSRVPAEHALLVLPREAAPPAVADWLQRPAKTRVIGSIYAPDEPASGFYLAGGALTEWFDAIVHTHRLSPSRLL